MVLTLALNYIHLPHSFLKRTTHLPLLIVSSIASRGTSYARYQVFNV